MPIAQVTTASTNVEFINGKPIDANELNNKINTIVSDIASLSNSLNSVITTVNNTSGDTIPSVEQASIDSFGGVFKNDLGNVMSIKETLMLFLQVVANTDNGLKEGVKVEETITAKTIKWPYTDNVFEPILLKKDGTTVTKAILGTDYTASLNTASKEITLTPLSGANIFGHIWHSTFSFS